MNQRQYEFQSLSWKNRLPLISSKVLVGLLIFGCSYLVVVGSTIPERMQMLSLTLTLCFMYANLAVLKHELGELVRPPMFLVGYPLAVLSTALYFGSFFI